ncbi:MAG: signal peptidase I, signal peptidase I [candidate division WS6 bacterium GW2011_GWC1_33_20]|uniref:Signal peptidase I n=2 Tax=Candidatus Dojkabacteria TaxID=74243 RepID=A0A0G0AU77_9BACT|nr:MAG: signal peptidase I, signal peptidase I [candidate division WS6 bacterium GW2011_GWE2_33_157]KKP43462.1 MAG: signal peptidase I, signal peptidase I [candidate division WS6 bacterium GW2011_GWC1_33_20]KKP44487.1 MAG: signal peptidase I, signal peptidase I [candidate division WS6 bacterium GW2011_GWF1_33_233]KKP54232.1 MAG: signal peptidase I, signal peptidase I [candidate division WS6 bacterium GW2011_WS6_33_547]KKP54946.1 MAG: signal peptidase I [candidate division WS6 bacterium GW2011_G
MYENSNENISDGKARATEVLGAVGGFISSFAETVLVALVLAIVLYLFIMTPHEVVGNSMYPTYKNGEFLMANKFTYKFAVPQRGDVIIFQYSDTQDFIKRIIGIPGDEVMIKDGKIYINGEQLKESNYLDASVITNGGSYIHEGQTITVQEGEYFVCGDNRPNSSDSREFGPIAKEKIKGKAWIVYFPFQEFRLVTHESYK